MRNPESPASPSDVRNPQTGKTTHYDGLTKREHFAISALQGLCANSERQFDDERELTSDAVSMADELLKELEKQNV